MSESIERWRAAIDAVDEELLRLLNERARLAAKVAELKVSGELPIRDCERETAVLTHMRRANRGPLDERAVSRIYGRILAESRRVQTRVIEEKSAAKDKDAD
ncbi:MAG: chorismate mutase [Acidobacteria bacterium 13_1_20CM_3_53_8]|nr:MAG: chorismate mutase [Acidobacteria bacterium 13_1_20CM_3_53_8]